MSSGGFRSRSLSTDAETTIEVLHLTTHKPRHYSYAGMLVVICGLIDWSFYPFLTLNSQPTIVRLDSAIESAKLQL